MQHDTWPPSSLMTSFVSGSSPPLLTWVTPQLDRGEGADVIALDTRVRSRNRFGRMKPPDMVIRSSSGRTTGLDGSRFSINDQSSGRVLIALMSRVLGFARCQEPANKSGREMKRSLWPDRVSISAHERQGWRLTKSQTKTNTVTCN